MSNSLFRKEMLKAQSSSWLGSIRIGRNPSFVLVSYVSAALAVIVILFGVFGHVTRKVRVTGLIMPTQGLIQLTTPQPATVQILLVSEGDVVHEGQTLAVLRTGQSSTQGSTTMLIAQNLKERRNALEQEQRLARGQYESQNLALKNRLSSLQRDLLQAQGELDVSKLRLKLAQKSVDRYNELSVVGYVSVVQSQSKQEELLDQELRVRNAERTLEGVNREIADLKAEIEKGLSTLESQLVQIDNSLAALSQENTENTARAEVIIIASRTGRIGAIATHEGQSVSPGQSILSLIPTSKGKGNTMDVNVQAELYTTSRIAGSVNSGSKVWLRLAAFPYQKFGMLEGNIKTVSSTPISAADLPPGEANSLQSNAQSNEPLYRISVGLVDANIFAYGKKQSLKVGMMVEADVMQDRRAIWEWIFEPLLSLQGRI